jgi:hypothetical protein
LSAEEVCAGFDLIYDFTQQQVYAWENSLPIIASLTAPETLIRFEAMHRRTQTTTAYDFPGGQSIIVEFHLSALPGPGTYDWLLSVHHPVYGDLCQREGSFVVRRPLPTITPGPESTAEAAPESTEEAP